MEILKGRQRHECQHNHRGGNRTRSRRRRRSRNIARVGESRPEMATKIAVGAKRNMDQKLKRMCAQLLQKTKIRGAEQPCVNACVAMCVCVCVCAPPEAIRQKRTAGAAGPAGAERRSAGFSHCWRCPKVDTLRKPRLFRTMMALAIPFLYPE